MSCLITDRRGRPARLEAGAVAFQRQKIAAVMWFWRELGHVGADYRRLRAAFLISDPYNAQFLTLRPHTH